MRPYQSQATATSCSSTSTWATKTYEKKNLVLQGRRTQTQGRLRFARYSDRHQGLEQRQRQAAPSPCGFIPFFHALPPLSCLALCGLITLIPVQLAWMTHMVEIQRATYRAALALPNIEETRIQNKRHPSPIPIPNPSWIHPDAVAVAASHHNTVVAVPPKTVAYMVSLIKCGDKQSTLAGLTDSALVLRHSIHQHSSRHFASGSQYDYRIIAAVHTQAAHCRQTLLDAGFDHVFVTDSPIAVNDIQGDYLRAHIDREWCCGSAEFIKLYAYTLTQYPLVVHMDMDFLITQPMDVVFDAMLLPVLDMHENNHYLWQHVPLENSSHNIGLPPVTRIDAAMTRDWPQVMPGRKPGFQAGFFIVRPNVTVYHTILNIIRQGQYVEGFGRDNGWGGKGYGAFVGAMTMQGLMAYVYDEIFPDSWVELNQCRFNHMGMDVLYRGPPSFYRKHPKVGHCRNDQDTCEDCMRTPLDQIYSIHYTQCRKTHNCIGERSSVSGGGRYTIPEESVDYDHCMQLLTVWHSYRSDLEDQLYHITGDARIVQHGRNGTYMPHVFQGHCQGNGGNNYLNMALSSKTLRRLPRLYNLNATVPAKVSRS